MRERTTAHDEPRFILSNAPLFGTSPPFQSSNKIEIRWERTSLARMTRRWCPAILAAQRALIQRGPGMQLFDFTVVIRQFRRLLSGIFKPRIQTNLSNARLLVLASANVGRSLGPSLPRFLMTISIILICPTHKLYYYSNIVEITIIIHVDFRKCALYAYLKLTWKSFKSLT